MLEGLGFRVDAFGFQDLALSPMNLQVFCNSGETVSLTSTPVALEVEAYNYCIICPEVLL